MREIPKPDLEEVFDHYGARIIGSDSGGWRKAECPLVAHDDKNPSASVNVDLCRWHCWTCDKSGDAMDLIGENEGVGLPDAIRFAEAHFGAGDSAVRGERGGSGLLPGRQGHKPGRRNITAPWLRL